MIELLQPFPAEVDIQNFFTGLGSLGMAPRPGAACLARSQRSRATQVLVHQGKSPTGDERKEDQVKSSQKVVQGWKALSATLVQRNVNRCPRIRSPCFPSPSFDLNSFTVSIRDQTTGRDLMSAPVPQRVLCGNAFKQFLEKRGIMFEPQSNLLFTFTNLTAATNNITLALHGYKIIL